MKLFIKNTGNLSLDNTGVFFFSFLFVTVLMFSSPRILLASSHDTFAGDTEIYGSTLTTVEPNVLFIIDNSGSMNDSLAMGDPYDDDTTYSTAYICDGSSSCDTNAVYRWSRWSRRWVKHINDVSSVSCTRAYDDLTDEGLYSGRLRTSGACGGRWSYSLALGNYINYIEETGGVTMTPKIDVARDVITDLINTTSGVKMGAMRFNSDDEGGDFITDNGYTSSIKDMDDIFSSPTTNREALVNAVNSLSAGGWTPLAETLFEAMRYYSGGSSPFNGGGTYTSPIEYSCQKNYIVLITDGMPTHDNNLTVLQSICTSGDCDGDAPEETFADFGTDYLDDVAHYLYNNDLIDDGIHAGVQRVVTYTIGFGLEGGNQDAVDLLQDAATNGGGTYFSAESYVGLSESLREIISNILQDNTSFVAPVVPVSPENKTYSGSRVYLGFFKPLDGAFWVGNLKKYGIDDSGNILDKNDAYATYVDNNGDNIDDRDSTTVPAGKVNGAFRDLAISYWSSSIDGAEVDIGGAGDVLFNRSTARNIYTYTGGNQEPLTHIFNAFTTSNNLITPESMGLNNETEKDKLINFVHGKDAYDEDSDGNTTENRSWILGDILHSKPVVVNYKSYTFTTANESNCSLNKSVIYVGTNDGMMHAFNDCDGEELWSFIPQDLFGELKYLDGSTHTYYMDSSPSVYIYDKDKDGNIEIPSDNDKVILMFGERRGGGYYYALDVSDSDGPEYMWRINNTGLWKFQNPGGDVKYDEATYTYADYSELGQTWSQPTISKIKDGAYGKIVAIIGAGYDNDNEDLRLGPDQGTSPEDAEGRGLYVIELATLDSSGEPSFSDNGHKVWGYTYGASASSTTHPNMQFSIPSAVASIDTDFNDYSDTLYVGDAGGNLWAFDIGDASTSNWVAREIFSSNPGSGGGSDVGRKIFYRPSVTLEVGYQMVLFGTGDRAHPTNTGVTDRLYAIKDKGQVSSDAIDEDDLVDVTDDLLQENGSDVSMILSNLKSLYGWYIMLEDNSGEKVLAPAVTLFRRAYYTTYAPITGGGDICTTGNRGTARIYAVNYKTGEAVYNYDTTNDGLSVTNTRAMGDGYVLQGSDRVITLGTSIPSGVVAVITTSGITAFVGCGGAVCQPPISSDGSTLMLYWREAW